MFRKYYRSFTEGRGDSEAIKKRYGSTKKPGTTEAAWGTIEGSIVVVILIQPV